MCNVHSTVFEDCLEDQQGSQLHHCHPSQARICMNNGSSPKGQRVGTLALIQKQQWATPAGGTWFSVVYLVDWWPVQPPWTQRGRGLQERLTTNTHGGLTNLCGQVSTAWPSQQLWERGHSPGNQLKFKSIFPPWWFSTICSPPLDLGSELGLEPGTASRNFPGLYGFFSLAL